MQAPLGDTVWRGRGPSSLLGKLRAFAWICGAKRLTAIASSKIVACIVICIASFPSVETLAERNACATALEHLVFSRLFTLRLMGRMRKGHVSIQPHNTGLPSTVADVTKLPPELALMSGQAPSVSYR